MEPYSIIANGEIIMTVNSQKDWSESEYVICEKCKGSGEILITLTYSPSPIVKCLVCGGKGRLIKTTSVKYKILD